jgi:hypothetical protein
VYWDSLLIMKETTSSRAILSHNEIASQFARSKVMVQEKYEAERPEKADKLTGVAYSLKFKAMII